MLSIAWVPNILLLQAAHLFVDAFGKPYDFQFLFRLRMKKRLWAAARSGLRECQFLSSYRVIGDQFPSWEDAQYKQCFRLEEEAYIPLNAKYGFLVTKQDTRMRNSVPSGKRLAMTILWLAHGLTYYQVAMLYGVGRTTAVNICQETVSQFYQHVVRDCIRLPEGSELDQVIVDMEDLAGLPQCAGAIDGTFVHIKKPTAYGDSYYCYKKITSIMLLATVDKRRIFTFVDAGWPGSVGDSTI